MLPYPFWCQQVNVSIAPQKIPTYRTGPAQANPIFFTGRVYQGAEGYVYPYPKYKKGEYPTSAKVIEDMAVYYKIPSINFAPSVIEKIESGKMVIDQSSGETDETRIFANDGTHPTNAGHELYKETIIRSLQLFLEKKGRKNHQLPVNKQTINPEQAKMIPSDSKQIIRVGGMENS